MLSDFFDAWSSTPAVLAVYKGGGAKQPQQQQQYQQQHTNNNTIASSGQIRRSTSPAVTSSSIAAAAARPGTTTMRVEDRLLTGERERVARLACKSKQLEERELKNCTGRPRIDTRSAALMEQRINTRGNSVVERLTAKTTSAKNCGSGNNNEHQQRMLADLQRREQEELERKQKEAAAAAAAAATPRINKVSRKLVADKMAMMNSNNNNSEENANRRGVESMLQWKAERDRKRRAAEDALREQEAREATGRPRLNPTSVAIAHNRRVLDGTENLDTVEDLLRRHQEHEERMKQKYEEMYGQRHSIRDYLHSQHQHHHDSNASSHVSDNNSNNNSQQHHQHRVDPTEVTQRLCQDAASRRERREQQQLAAGLLSFVDPVTGEVLFRPNINHRNGSSDHHHHHGDEQEQQHEAENDEEEEAANLLRKLREKHRHEPGFWDRLSRRPEKNNNHSDEKSTSRSRSPSISQYSRLLAEIHRGREATTTQSGQNNDNGGKESDIFNRLSKPHQRSQQQQQQLGGFRLASCSSSSRSCSRDNNNNADNEDADNNNSPHPHVFANRAGNENSASFHPQVNEHSRQLDPRRNERGMARIEGLLQHERERQQQLEQLQREQCMREEMELAALQQQHQHSYHHDPHRDRQSQEAFADRQAAWEARRRQKVSAKAAQRQEQELDKCSFQPTLAPPPPPSMLMPRGF